MSFAIQFAWADPGKPRADAATFDLPLPNPVEPLPNFCLLLLKPVEVDHLELRGEPQNRTIYNWRNIEQIWSIQSVNP